ncbi:putative sugar permease [Neospora caninum Liverpool]|nr:putative sugar permease [Neospora caninum Liverpool]CBZ53222.1 putative sugar permease [Neospora caninum Liverpool]|eukprot:XP_003883254.1 putative sugar permease [Neospora caninum Liverpool]
MVQTRAQAAAAASPREPSPSPARGGRKALPPASGVQTERVHPVRKAAPKTPAGRPRRTSPPREKEAKEHAARGRKESPEEVEQRVSPETRQGEGLRRENRKSCGSPLLAAEGTTEEGRGAERGRKETDGEGAPAEGLIGKKAARHAKRKQNEGGDSQEEEASKFWSVLSFPVQLGGKGNKQLSSLASQCDASVSTVATLGSSRASPSSISSLFATQTGVSSKGNTDSDSEKAPLVASPNHTIRAPFPSLSPPSSLSRSSLSSSFASTWCRTASLFASSSRPSSSSRLSRLHLQQFILTFFCYSALYLTRKPFASARATLQRELRLSTADMGCIDTAFLSTYAFTQLLLAAPVAARFAHTLRTFFLLAYALSSFSCLFVAFAPPPLLRLPALLLAWAVNGAAQALVFPFLVSILRQWLSRLPRGGGGAFGVWSTCQQAGSMAASYVAAELLSSSSLLLLPLPEPRAPWRLVFLVPGLCVLLSGGMLFFFLIENPAARFAELEAEREEEKENGERPVGPKAARAELHAAGSESRTAGEMRKRRGEAERQVEDRESGTKLGTCSDAGTISRKESEPKEAPAVSAGQLLWTAAKVRGVGELCGAYFCMKLVRYLLINWLPLFLQTHLLLSPLQATWGSILFEAGGVAGAVLVGVLSDRLCSGRRFVVITPLCLLAACCALLLAERDPNTPSQLSVQLRVLLFLLGSCVAGPDSVLGGMAAADVCAEEAKRTKKDHEEGNEPREQDKQQLVATASCLVNGSGSIGSILQGTLTPLIVAHYG